MSTAQFDVLIIGSGIAGLASAIKLAEEGLHVGIITREKDPKITNTYWAQGGIIYTNEDHSLVDDIQKASSETSNIEAAKILSQRSGQIVKEILLEKANSNFSKSESGNLNLTREAAHSIDRIIYKGDYTGKEIQISLLNYVKDKTRFPNVSILAGHTAIDLITPNHHGNKIQHRYLDPQVIGAYVLNQDTDEVLKILASKTILATGGIGALYLHHSNSEGARGDGHAMAKRAGVPVINMEFIQFHPTTFFDSSSHRRFLVSEAVRGEGGKLINSLGERFMTKYHPDGELAPRDVVSRAIAEEIIRTKHECVYLDISFKESEWIKNRFPTIYQHCLDKRVDITKDPIPVVPSAHYTCGGVKTDVNGKTPMKNLFAVGEVSCNGIHGANRLASTSLCEGLTFGYIAAETIIKENNLKERFPDIEINDWFSGDDSTDQALVEQDWLTLKQTMWNYVGLIRSKNRLKRAKAMFTELYDEIGRFYKHAKLSDNLIGLRNAAEVAHLVLSASERNKNSIGCFYRKN